MEYVLSTVNEQFIVTMVREAQEEAGRGETKLASAVTVGDEATTRTPWETAIDLPFFYLHIWPDR